MNDNPILNNPYEEPMYHYDTDLAGNLDYNKIIAGRRPYTAGLGVNPGGSDNHTLFSGSDFESDTDLNAPFINGIREEVKKWRDNSYPNTTKVTRDLLSYWFNDPDRQIDKNLFFCQREAIETAIYLNEVADHDPNTGRYILSQLAARVEAISDDPDYRLPRTAFKMATGTGKTVVMAMLILYNYLNKQAYHQDTRFADHFLLVAPGITIRDRLCVLYIDESRKQDYDKNDYYHQRMLIPSSYENLLGGLNAAITITNYHQFEPKVYTGKKASPFDGKMKYVNGDCIKQSDKESFSSVFNRLLGRQMKGKRIVVINDEAHHCYLPKTIQGRVVKDEEFTEGTAENEKAMVWYEGLRQMKLNGYKIDHVYDLSATPYYLKGSGHKEYSLFPWVVSDFGLVDAIESGLVKIPFLPKTDNTTSIDEPVLRNIYEHIRHELPKKGARTTKSIQKANEEVGALKAETPPNLPSLLNMAFDQFIKDYEEYNKGIRLEGEESMGVFSTPPVFIIVCNNTTVSKEVFKYLAGYETVDAEGKTIYIDGKYPIFSNYRNNIPLKKAPTLLVDSAAIDEAGATINDEFKSVFKDEIEQFKREYARQHGSGSADNLSDGDILREVVNTVGKPGTLGSHIKCVVSVSMLTEGWDANSVTHVCGIRAFGSQLLCEQVAGRALRRMKYDLRAYDKRTGEEIESKDIRKYKKENVTYKFPPEYAHIIGVPFKTFKGGTETPPGPPKPIHQVKSLPERSDYEIKFPNIVGYRCEYKDGVITVDYTDVPKLVLNFVEIPPETCLATAVGATQIVLKSDYKELRDSQVIYQLTQWLIHDKYTDAENGRQFQKFFQLKKVVEQWYNSQVEIFGGDGSLEQRRLVIFWNRERVVSNIYEGIKNAAISNDVKITAILNYYNPEGSTANINKNTTKEVLSTIKSHLNYVVCDTDTWEQLAAKALEEIEQVKYYVKNQFIGFKIPYIDGVVERDYITDFIAVCETKAGKKVNLIIEISGFSNDRTGSKDAKRYYTQHYWIPAANNLEKYGRWDFIEITDIATVKETLIEKINSL